nr:integrase, catalytic region, zinc finger, CCHC-type, peptidase aspartic, catalytic [Tanacetum cinerariifolium]
METIHVEFDGLTTMASEQFGSGPVPQLLTPGYSSSGLPSPSVLSHVLPTPAPIHAETTSTSSSTTIDQDAPSASTSPTNEETQAPVIHQDLSFEESSSRDVIPLNLHQINQPFNHLKKWTKYHPLDNVTGNPSRHVSTRRQLQTDAMWCYFDAFLTNAEPKNYKEAMKESCWIKAIKEEIHKFDQIQVWELVPRLDHIMLIISK